MSGAFGGDRTGAGTAEWVNSFVSFSCVIHFFSINVCETRVAATVMKSKQINSVLRKLIINITKRKDPIFLTALINLAESIWGHVLTPFVVRNRGLSGLVLHVVLGIKYGGNRTAKPHGNHHSWKPAKCQDLRQRNGEIRR